MAVFRFLRRRRYTWRELAKATFVFSIAAVIFCMPWMMLLQYVLPATILGMDGGFFLIMFALPLLIAGGLIMFSTIADDIERRLRRFENE